MKVFIHIGSHKTGTTAIQQFASDNNIWLRQNGLLYPSLDLIDGPRERSHLGLINRIIKSTPTSDTESPLKVLLAAKLVAEKEGLDIFFSAESIFRLNDSDADKVKNLFSEVFGNDRVIVVCSLRPRIEFCESLYRNTFRAFAKVPGEFLKWMRAAEHNFKYEQVLGRYSNGFSAEQRVLPYNAKTRDTFVPLFFNALGIDIKNSQQQVQDKNPSLDAVDCLAKWLVMNGLCDEKTSRAFNNFCFKKSISTEYGFVDSDIETAIYTRFADEDQRMIAAYPQLVDILGPDIPRVDQRPIDKVAHALSQERASDFFSSRTM